VLSCVAQAIMANSSDYRFIATADKRLRHALPAIPTRDAFHKRRLRLSSRLEALIAHFARYEPGFFDALLLVDSGGMRPLPGDGSAWRSQQPADALADAAD
jgi:uncharacterized damage-inducible protein DinB